MDKYKKAAQKRMARMMGKESIGLHHDLPEHPFDRYVEHFDVGDEITETASKFDSPSDIERKVFRASRSRQEAVSTISLYLYARQGKNTFRVGPRLQEMFANTSLKGIDPETIGDFPYTCFYLDLKDFNRKIWVRDTGWHQIRGAFVLDYVGIDDERKWICNVWGIENESSDFLGDDAQYSIGFSHDEWVESGKDLEEYLKWRYKESRDEAVALGVPDLERQTESVHKVFRTAAHLSLYLKGDPELKENIYERKRDKLNRALKRKKNPNSKKARRIERKLKKITSSKVTIVAPSIESGDKIEESEDPGKGVKRHWVRGHWRRQPYGPRDNPKYKIIWIQPHLRGDENKGSVDDRDYIVE